MSFKNFMPEVWAVGIDRALSKECVFVEDCYRRFEGQVKKQGDSVRFMQIAPPTIKSIAYENRNKDIDKAEELQEATLVMPIRQIRYFNYKVGDIDKQQAIKGYMQEVNQETAEKLAEEVDTYIANLAKEKTAIKDSAEAYVISKDNILDKIDDALAILYKNNVRRNSKIVLTGSVDFVKVFEQAYTKLDTSNSNWLKHGGIGMYKNILIKMSNNVATDGSGAELIQLKTQRAIGFAKPLTHNEAYRPQEGFADAIKGFILFDAKILRPKEMVVMNVKYK